MTEKNTRLKEKTHEPSENEIKEQLGKAYSLLIKLEDLLNKDYVLKKELRFPFGKNYGWGYKYSHRTRHLIYVFFEEDAFTVTVRFGDVAAAKIQQDLKKLSDKTRELWDNRYPCGKNGGWIHYRVENEIALKDIMFLINTNVKVIGNKK